MNSDILLEKLRSEFGENVKPNILYSGCNTRPSFRIRGEVPDPRMYTPGQILGNADYPVRFSETCVFIGLEDLVALGKSRSYDFTDYASTSKFFMDHIRELNAGNKHVLLSVPDVTASPVIATLGYFTNDMFYKMIFVYKMSLVDDAMLLAPSILMSRNGLFYHSYTRWYDTLLKQLSVNTCLMQGLYEDLPSVEEFIKFKQKVERAIKKNAYDFEHLENTTYYAQCIRYTSQNRSSSSPTRERARNTTRVGEPTLFSNDIFGSVPYRGTDQPQLESISVGALPSLQRVLRTYNPYGDQHRAVPASQAEVEGVCNNSDEGDDIEF